MRLATDTISTVYASNGESNMGFPQSGFAPLMLPSAAWE
jgi:hypothetical protein